MQQASNKKSNLQILLGSIYFKIGALYVLWKVYLIFLSLVAIKYIPLGYKDRFLGGGSANYHLAPEVFSWANFDGEHYLSIAIFGYKGLEQAFFPVFPLLISLLSSPFSYDLTSALFFGTLSGMFITSVSFFLALIFLWKLIVIDFSPKIAYWTIIVLLLFPTAFYFNAVYNEALFLLLAVLSFYFARKNNWMLAGIFGAVSSATRIFGLMIFPSLLLDGWRKKILKQNYFWIFLVPIGLLTYMGYQWITTGDPLTFYKLQKIVGEQHQSGITLLPQVYYRYIKMLLTVDITNPIYQTIVLEFITGIAFFLLPIYGYFKKIPLHYLLFALAGFLLPTIQGSLSSVPRYIIVFFPSFIALAFFINSLPRIARFSFLIVSFLWLSLETMLFIRGYWVA